MADSDGYLLAKFSQHAEHTAFAALVQRYRPLVAATCRRILGSGSDADDVVQATFFQLARCAERLTRDANMRRSLGPWLTRVATNICHDIARSRAARREHEREYVRRSSAATESTSAGQLTPLVDELIAELPPELREPIVLCYLEGIEHAQAAVQLGLSVGTLRRRIQSAKSLLKSRIAARGIPISMFLLHMLLDNRANGGSPEPSPTPAAPTAAQPPAPLNHFPPQVAPHSVASPLGRTAISGSAAWSIKVGLVAAAVGIIPVLHGLLSGEAPALATVDAATRAAAAEPLDAGPAPEAAPPAVEDVTPPLTVSQVPGPKATEPPTPKIGDSLHSTELEAEPESAPPLKPVVENASGTFETPEDPGTETVAVPEELTVVAATSESEVPSPETVITKKSVHPRQVRELFGIDWHTTLESAREAAQVAPARPILCFRVLGELSGFM